MQILAAYRIDIEFKVSSTHNKWFGSYYMIESLQLYNLYKVLLATRAHSCTNVPAYANQSSSFSITLLPPEVVILTFLYELISASPDCAIYY